jgi:hypothetical protein
VNGTQDSFVAPERRSTRITAGAIAESLSGVAVLVIAVVVTLSRPEVFPAILLAIGWGVLGLLSGVGLYLSVRLARVMSFIFSAPNAVLVGLAVVIGGADPSAQAWQTIVLGLISVAGFITLLALGQLGRVFGWMSS